MPNVRLIHAQDFTGGLNLRADPFQLGENESPEMLNVEVDPRGGFATRRAWEDWQELSIGGDDWDPRALYSHVLGDGTEVIFLANDTSLWVREQGGSWAEETITLAGDPHLADFATWNDDCFIACGRTQPSQRWTAGVLTEMDDPSGAGSWSNDPLAPESDTMPQAEFVAVHAGYLWVANTREGGDNYPHRVRFSFPNDPDAWAEQDYIDIPEGGGPITGIIPLGDQLLVFFPSAVFAIYGYDLASFGKNSVTRTVGAVNRQCIARSETAVYFASWPEGVHSITSDSVDEVSVSLRPMLQSNLFSTNTDLQYLGWAAQRLYWSVPYSEDGAPTQTKTVFVLDPSLGSWTVHRSGCGCGIAPVTNGVEANGPIAATRFGPSILKLWGQDSGVDVIGGDNYSFDSWYRTRWFDAGMPSIKKRWRRPDVIADVDDSPHEITIYVFHDFDSANAKRTKVLSVSSAGDVGTWFADPDWDGTDASLETPPVGEDIWDETPDPAEAGWGEAPGGSSIERASSLGSARAVQLEFRGTPGQWWGINALVLKYLLRRVR